MKLIALTAALMMGGAAIAQETPMPATPPAGSTSPAQDANQQAPTTPDSAGTTGAGTATEPATTPMADPRGGYMPSGSPFSTGMPPAPGQQVIVRASPDPRTAFPAPAPLAKYPVCKRGQFDDCVQRGRR